VERNMINLMLLQSSSELNSQGACIFCGLARLSTRVQINASAPGEKVLVCLIMQPNEGEKEGHYWARKNIWLAQSGQPTGGGRVGRGLALVGASAREVLKRWCMARKCPCRDRVKRSAQPRPRRPRGRG
jgi:hypothetical protein